MGLCPWTEQEAGKKVWVGEKVYFEGRVDWAPWSGHLLDDPELSVGEGQWVSALRPDWGFAEQVDADCQGQDVEATPPVVGQAWDLPNFRRGLSASDSSDTTILSSL